MLLLVERFVGVTKYPKRLVANRGNDGEGLPQKRSDRVQGFADGVFGKPAERVGEDAAGAAAPLESGDVFDRLCGAFLLVGRMQVEIDAAERTLVLRLAENDGDLLVQGDAVPEVGPAVQISFDGFFHQ